MEQEKIRESNTRAGNRLGLLIWLFALFVIAVAWVVPLQRLQDDRREIIDAAIRDNENRATMLQQYVSRTLEAAEIATLHIAERHAAGDPTLRGSSERPSMIRGPIVSRQSFLGLSIADEQGNLVASTRGAAVAGRNVRSHEAFLAHVSRDTGRLYVSRPARSRRFERPVIWLTRRLNKPDGSFDGVVAINIAPEQLIGFHRAVVIRPRDVISIIGLDGMTRARRTGDVFSSGEDVTNGLVMRRQQADPDGTYVGPSALDGLVRYFSHRRLENYPLFATYGVMREDVLAPVRRRQRLYIGGSMLISVVTLIFAVALIALLRRRDRWAAEIAETNLRLQEAQRIGQIGNWDFDLHTRAISWSPQMFKMYERDPGRGAPTVAEFESWLDAGSRDALDGAVARLVNGGKAASYALTVRLPSGAESHRLVSAVPVRDGEGRVVAIRGTDQDVSERRKLDQLEAEVSYLSRVGAMNAMAATLAHELNQPLAAASNYLVGSRRLLAKDGPAAQAVEGLEAAQHQVHFAGEIIRRVRAMVSNEPKQMTPTPIARIIDDALALALPAAAGRRMKVTKEIARDARYALCDRVQVQQVLLNLVRNACEAVADVAQPRIAITCRRTSAEQLLVSVQDNGPGLKDAGAPLFTAFASDKPTGLGLGLSISRTIIESHGGRIWAENMDGPGACFSFTLPASDAASGN